MVRLAYFITAHQYPEQVARLIGRIRTTEDSCILSAFNVRTKEDQREWISLAGNNSDFVQRVSTSPHNIWGSFTQVTENLAAMSWSRTNGFDYFVNLSAQCYPLWPVDHVKSVLEAEQKSHIEIHTHREGRSGGIVDVRPRPLRSAVRIHGAPMNVYRFTDWWCNPIHVAGKQLMLRIPNVKRRLPFGLEPCYGSGWFCLRRNHVEAILDFVHLHPLISRLFRHNGIPIENFFNTVAWRVVQHDELSGGNMRLESWDEGGLHIQPVLSTDIPALLSSRALWARKFDQHLDQSPLNEIDRRRFGAR